jgi:pSer/pThr/pTyr-binding forkhead associated (FHA) protein
LIQQLTTIGRGPKSGIRLAGDREVASEHALLWVDEFSLRVRDERTVSGTFVNGERLRPGLGRELAFGDTLRVGASVWTVQVLPEGEPPAAEPLPSSPVGAARPRPLPDWLMVVGALAAVVAAAAAAIVALGNR